MEMPFDGHFMLTPTLGIYEVFYPSSSDSEFAGGHGYCFCFSDGRVFEIIVNHYPRRLTIKKWCNVSKEEFSMIMLEVYNSLI
jgi:hypothetical protein